MTQDKIPTRPVVTSRLAADTQMHEWLSANEVKTLHDQDGSTWKLRVEVNQLPDPDDLHRPVWEIMLRLNTALSGDDLLKAGVFDADADGRLVTMLGGASIPMSMRPLHIKAYDLEQARNEFIAALERLKREFPRTPLRDVKRRLANTWVENRCIFGSDPLFPA